MRNYLIVLCVLCGLTANAQFKNITLDVQTEGVRPPAEPSVAISMKDKDIIVGGSIVDKVYYTKNGGKSWETKRLKSSLGAWGDPVIVSDKKGDFYYFHLSDPTGKNWASEEVLDRIVCQKSTDGGETWSDGASIGYNHPKDQDKQWAVVNPQNNALYTTWTQFDKYGSKDSTCYSNILFSMSSNGKKWSDPIQINQLSGNCLDKDQTTEGAVPAVDSDGRLYTAWSYDEKIYLDRSFDKGKTWLRNDIEIFDQPGGWTFDIPGINRVNGMPVLIADKSPTQYKNMLYLNWSDQRNGEDNTDIWFSRSANYGDSWSSPVKVNNDDSGKHQFFSWMTVDQTTGIIYIVYYDRRNYDDMQTDVYLAYSNNAGLSFENVKISESPFIPNPNSFFGDYTNISAHDGRIVPIWTRMDNGKTSIITTIIEQEDLFGSEDEAKGKKKKGKKGKKKKKK